MALLYRSLLARNCLKPLNAYNSIISTQTRAVVMRATPAATDSKEDFISRNERLGRPMSPHLTIYRFQVTSVLSISHRITGMMVSGYVYGFTLATLMLPASFPHYCAVLTNMHISPALLFAAKLLVAFPFSYHFCNGIRHLMWDMAKGLEIKQVYSTGYAMLGASAVMTLGLLML